MQEKRELKVMRGSGLTSCLMVRLSDWHEYYHCHGYPPDVIDGSQQYSYYRDTEGQNVSALLFEPYVPVEFKWMQGLTEFHHEWQYKWYDQMPLNALRDTNEVVNPFSKEIQLRVQQFTELIGDRTVVMYRGNDKCYEILRTPYHVIKDMAEETRSNKYFVMTDEIEFFEFFQNNFEDVITTVKNPMIHCNPNKFYYPPPGQRIEFAMDFYALLTAISKAKKVIMTTGNIGLTVAILRGHTEGLWQNHGGLKLWRKLL
jgi:hypothetical protein